MYLNDETKLSMNGVLICEDDGSLSNFARQYLEFYEAVENGRESISSGDKIIEVIRVQEAALESAKIHQVVEL